MLGVCIVAGGMGWQVSSLASSNAFLGIVVMVVHSVVQIPCAYVGCASLCSVKWMVLAESLVLASSSKMFCIQKSLCNIFTSISPNSCA